MSKRERPLDSASSTSRPPKRPKANPATEEPHEEIESARHLQLVLVFEQNIEQSLKAIRIFKAFLDSILYAEAEHDVPRKRAILSEYLDYQRPREIDEETVYLSNLMQAWSYAASSNSDKLLSATASILALLVKVLSNHIDFRENGLLLCKTILQQSQLKLIARGLSAMKSKEYVIAPCIRLLTEVVCFDGGTLARQVYAKRDLTFDTKILARNLTIRKLQSQEPEDEKRRPSVRTTAVRYLLANFKFQNEGAKADILKQANILRALIDGIELDPTPVIREIVYSLTTYVINDPAVPRRNKSYMFNDRNLFSLCRLYRVELPEEEVKEDWKPLMTIIHEMMVAICTSPDVGVVKQSGWYPSIEDDASLDEQAIIARPEIDLGLDALEYYGKFKTTIPIRNWALGEFILTLRPYAFDLERQLLVSIFEAAPELVAWFYLKIAANFTFAPKLTATWIGYAAFLFSTVQLPLPRLLNRMSHLPPPVTVVIESILPQPLTQKVLRQCTSNPSDLIKFFTIRIITVAFLKLQGVIKMFQEQAKNGGKLWDQAIEKLIAEFCRRCPVMKDITKLYSELKNSSSENKIQREAVARLLCLYYEVTPQVALDENFDISIPLASALQAVEGDEAPSDEKELRLLELSHLVKIARWSPAISWWSKPKTLKFSPFMTLLRLIIRTPQSSTEIKSLVAAIVKDCGVLQSETNGNALDALIISLTTLDGFEPADATFEFLDDCFQRFVRKPIKYEDDKDALVHSRPEVPNAPISLLWLTLLEQWPFVEKTRKEFVGPISQWISRFCAALKNIGESPAIVFGYDKTVGDAKLKVVGVSEIKGISELCRSLKELSAHKHSDQKIPSNEDPESTTSNIQDSTPHPLDLSMFQPPPEDEKHTALTKWSRKDLASAVEEGDLGALILSLTSTHLSIRIQAISALRQLTKSLQSSTYPEKDQIYLLLCELVETAQPILDSGAVFSGLATTWAAHAVDVLADPTHVLYPKVNEFLNKGPRWRVSRMAEYWANKIILQPPDDEAEGAYYRELVWLLDWLYDGLQTGDDVEPLRKYAVFERILAIFSHPALNPSGNSNTVIGLVKDGEKLKREASLQARIRPMILMIVCRAVVVGGSTTLITRTGILAWIGEVKCMPWLGQEGVGFLEDMEREILNRREKERLEEWSTGTL